MAITERPTSIWNDEFLDDLEELRTEFLKERPREKQKIYGSKEEAAAAKRVRHRNGGLENHKFEGERYLNCEDKEIRRRQLRKLIDEGGQQSCGVGLPSHTELYAWNSKVLGVSEEEIHELKKQDLGSNALLTLGWRIAMHRDAPWAVTIGSSLVGEGSKLVPEIQAALQDEIEELRRTYTGWGIKGEDLSRALALDIEHAGVDIEHARLGADTVLAHVKTDEDKAEMRREYILTMHMRTDF